MTVSRRDVIKGAGCGCAALSLLDVLGQVALATPADGTYLPVADQLKILPPGAVRLDGYLERYIRLSLDKWSKGVLPYGALAGFFRSGRPKVETDGHLEALFATGEMWGKAVRSAALLYRYTADPALKALLDKTV